MSRVWYLFLVFLIAFLERQRNPLQCLQLQSAVALLPRRRSMSRVWYLFLVFLVEHPEYQQTALYPFPPSPPSFQVFLLTDTPIPL